MTDAGVTFWLGLIAVASLLQVALLAAGAAVLVIQGRRLQARAEQVRRETVEPLVARTNQLLDDLQTVLQRVRDLDDDFRRTVTRAGDRVQAVTHMVRARTLSVVGVAHAVRAAAAVLVRGRRPPKAAGHSPVLSAGGIHHARH
jgi:hypothetical protein